MKYPLEQIEKWQAESFKRYERYTLRRFITQAITVLIEFLIVMSLAMYQLTN